MKPSLKRNKSAAFFVFCIAASISSAAEAQETAPKAHLEAMSPVDQRAGLTKGFNYLDKDHSGFIEINEAPPTMVRDQRGGALRKVGSGELWVSHYDINHDDKVSMAEYIDGTIYAINHKRPDGTVCIGNCPPVN